MGTPNIIQNLMSGDMANVNRGMPNLGKPVTNNQGAPGQLGSSPSGSVGTFPGAPPNPLEPGSTILSGSSGFNTPPQLGGMPRQQAYSTTAGNGSGVLASTNSAPPGTVGTIPQPGTPGDSVNPVGNLTPQQQQELNKQLVDIYGKGEGNLLDSLIGSIGGGNDAYMQAYEASIAGPNAENLATLNTTLGNSGVSANSSAAAIANADFQSNITAQEGLQVQQLQMNDLQQLMSLTQGLQGQSAQEVSSGGFLNDLASITSSIGNLIPGTSGGNKGNAGNVGSGSVVAQGTLAAAQAAGANGVQTTPTDTSGLPDLTSDFGDPDTLADYIGQGVFI